MCLHGDIKHEKENVLPGGDHMGLGEKGTNQKKHILIYLIAVALIVVVTISGVPQKIKQYFKDQYHSEEIKKVEQISIKDNQAVGNTNNNINNYGLLAETKDFYYYIKEMHIHRSDKDFKNEKVLVNEPVNQGKDTLNIVDHWIFYRQGDEINRFDTKEEKNETIFRNISFNMHVIGNWLYLIDADDGYKLYKMDVNGQNAEVLHEGEIGALSLSIYDDQIYYSYKKDEKSYLERMDLDGKNKEVLANVLAERMVIDHEYIYYLDLPDNQLYRKQLKSGETEKLANEKIFSFVKDDKHIFYTLKIADGKYHEIKGIYRMNLDGEDVKILDDKNYLHDVGLGITQDWLFYNTTHGPDSAGLRRISKDGKESIYMETSQEAGHDQ